MNAEFASNFQFSFVLSLAFILLVPFAIAGLSLINVGLGRSRSAAHFMTSSLCVAAIAMLIYFAFGAAIKEGLYSVPSWALTEPKAPLTSTGLFLHGLDWSTPASLTVLLMIFSVALSSVIPLGSSVDRLRLGAACLATVFLAGWLVPILFRAGSELYLSSWMRIPSPLDDGAGFINVTGGLTALSVSWLLGQRHGKYSSNGMPAAIPGHNAVFVLFGCMLAWVGWMGLNAAGAMLHAGTKPEQSVLVVLNTTFSAAAAALTAAAVTRIRYHRPDASLIANGWMAGLVASSAGCATFKPAIAILVGLVAGALVVFSVEWFELGLKVDDPCGSISVHAVCGLWGLMAVGIFAGIPGQFMAQLVGIATLLGLIFPMTYGLNWLLNRFIPYRVSPDGERQGLDLHELGADAYPEFVVHSDEFMPR